MPIADKMVGMVKGATMVRKMFEEGIRLREIHGADKVFDFSLGNPDVPPPAELKEALLKLVQDGSLSHGYMPNSGYPGVRSELAGYLSSEYGVELRADDLIMTVGAAGALNDALKALVNPGEEVLTPSPYFVGYQHYTFTADAVLKTVPTNSKFHLDLAAIDKALNEKTRVFLINSPNNPTGAVYSDNEISALADILENNSQKFGRRIYLVSDEPYRKIVYDVGVPSVFAAYPHSLVVSSFSKELSLAGERIGYLAVNPKAEDAPQLVAAAAIANTMYVVNAPSLFQLAVARVLGVAVDVSRYRRRRDMLCSVLGEAGYTFTVPKGAFYLFPQSPIPDDIKFAELLKEERVLVTPGAAFGGPGYFRVSYAVPEAAIEGSLDGFRRAREKAV
jgi:aspartate aminotransferase